MAHYETLQAILKEAGLSHAVYSESPSGTIDGSNKAFTVANKPLTDANGDDKVDTEDVQAYVDGTPVVVEEVDARFGTITLTQAPTESADITIDYWYSNYELSEVERIREEAEAWINNRMKSVDPCAPYGTGDDPVPATVRNLCRRYAAALLLIREYGYNQDTEDTSKDGYRRLEAVKADLEAYALAGGECGESSDGGDDGGLGDISATSDGDLFGRFEDIQRPNSDGRW